MGVYIYVCIYIYLGRERKFKKHPTPEIYEKPAF